MDWWAWLIVVAVLTGAVASLVWWAMKKPLGEWARMSLRAANALGLVTQAPCHAERISSEGAVNDLSGEAVGCLRGASGGCSAHRVRYLAGDVSMGRAMFTSGTPPDGRREGQRPVDAGSARDRSGDTDPGEIRRRLVEPPRFRCGPSVRRLNGLLRTPGSRQSSRNSVLVDVPPRGGVRHQSASTLAMVSSSLTPSGRDESGRSLLLQGWSCRALPFADRSRCTSAPLRRQSMSGARPSAM